ncbi:alpha/beta hydrolase-fold protein [Flavitalea sp. BT771]|uniref:carboxylesterase family protein n=1 Tax=Flavitalea sp. BT771 TaxID=3063329 RepID=UPI0026E2232A|nr:alpha/beta hydrolase-fold protein [Flavitalea sp. BT771]MDO6435741.1 alpha/beta hydrolase-fold protein [Flavitalea sp. BT771]MDV6224642.1 alpha/beta hydrolase-fold protein [Flavitalea sp. BT771]
MLKFQKLGNYSLPLLSLTLGVSVLYAISLILLRARGNRWLKATGAVMLVIGLIFLSAIIWGSTNPSVAKQKTLQEVSQLFSFASCLIPVFFMMHFLSERKKAAAFITNMPEQRHMGNTVWSVGILLSALTLIFGLMLSSDCYSSVYWANWNYQKTKELSQLCEPGVFANSKGILHYRVLRPLDYDATRKYPIVVSLPYGGQPATDTIRQIEGAVAAQLLIMDGNRRKYPAFVFIPNCPPDGGWGGVPHYPTVDSLVFDALIALDKQFSIDEKRRYVVGLSRGGFGAWNFICKRPDMFAAAIPVSGGGDPGLAPKIVGVAVWAFHGAKDMNVPVVRSRNMISAIKSAGGNPQYTEFPNEGHNIWDDVSKTPGLLDWLFAQHRK